MFLKLAVAGANFSGEEKAAYMLMQVVLLMAVQHGHCTGIAYGLGSGLLHNTRVAVCVQV